MQRRALPGRQQGTPSPVDALALGTTEQAVQRLFQGSSDDQRADNISAVVVRPMEPPSQSPYSSTTPTPGLGHDRFQTSSNPLRPFSPLSGTTKPQSVRANRSATELPEILCKRATSIERLLGRWRAWAPVYPRPGSATRNSTAILIPMSRFKDPERGICEYPMPTHCCITEFALTSRLRHSNVIRLYAFDVDPQSQTAPFKYHGKRSRGRHWIRGFVERSP